MSGSLARSETENDVRTCHDGLEGFIGYNLKRAYMLFQSDFRESVGEDGLTPRSFSALSLVVESPGITQSELSRYLGIERSGLVALVDDLEKRGLLQRVPVPGDRRVQALEGTRRGQEAHERMMEAARRHEDRVLSPLDGGERETLLRLLRKLRSRDEDRIE